MIKHVFVGFLNGADETDGWRWYLRYHSKEVTRFFGPWLRRYETFKAYPPPAEAAKWGAVGGYMTELWYASVDDFIEAKPNSRPYTFPEWFRKLKPQDIAAAITIVPAMPTEDFLGKEPTPEERHILRWYRAFKYPAGVSAKDGEKWYLETHSQEVKKQPGLLRYISHRTLENPPIQTPWVRTEELWYEDFGAWRKANVESLPAYTPPPWSRQEPFADVVSVFIGYKPYVDFLKDNPLIP
jgi:hypothetical protein